MPTRVWVLLHPTPPYHNVLSNGHHWSHQHGHYSVLVRAVSVQICKEWTTKNCLNGKICEIRTGMHPTQFLQRIISRNSRTTTPRTPSECWTSFFFSAFDVLFTHRNKQNSRLLQQTPKTHHGCKVQSLWHQCRTFSSVTRDTTQRVRLRGLENSSLFCSFLVYFLPWEPTTFIFRGYNPYFGGVKPSFFMVLGSKGRWCFQSFSIFTPIPAKDDLTSIFQMGWNHELETVARYVWQWCIYFLVE